MANFKLNIPPDLEARIEALGDSINWSEVLRPAIQAAIAAFEQQRRHQAEAADDPADNPAHEPPATFPPDDRGLGRRAGAAAARTLDPHAVSALCMIPTAAISEDYAQAMVKAALDPENRLAAAAFNHDYFDNENPSQSYLMGFIEGVQEVAALGEERDSHASAS